MGRQQQGICLSSPKGPGAALCLWPELSLFVPAYKEDICVPAHIDILCASAYIRDMSDLARTPKQIGAIIQRVRKRRGWTQMMLAERAGLRQATISMIEGGENPAKLDSLLAILAALDLEFRIADRSKGRGRDIEELF